MGALQFWIISSCDVLNKLFLIYLFNKLIMCLMIALQVNLQIVRFLTHGLNSHNIYIYICVCVCVCARARAHARACRIINYRNLENKP